jgi:hypothetical protein
MIGPRGPDCRSGCRKRRSHQLRSHQLLSIPFAYRQRAQFIGIFDAMASILPLAVVGSVLVGAAFFQAGYLASVPRKLEAALIMLAICVIDLFGGYAINIALSRRQFNVT